MNWYFLKIKPICRLFPERSFQIDVLIGYQICFWLDESKYQFENLPDQEFLNCLLTISISVMWSSKCSWIWFLRMAKCFLFVVSAKIKSSIIFLKLSFWRKFSNFIFDMSLCWIAIHYDFEHVYPNPNRKDILKHELLTLVFLSWSVIPNNLFGWSTLTVCIIEFLTVIRETKTCCLITEFVTFVTCHHTYA